MVERVRPEVWDVLEEVIKEHPVLLNRAPTLHRLGIQAFEPVLVEGRAIQIHPLVCVAYNADFDGDQMAVHVPLSAEAQAEARILMLSSHNILLPASGRAVTTPTQDMVIGCYYLTQARKEATGSGRVFASSDEVLMALAEGTITLHSWVKVRMNGELLETTPGRIIFNEALPEDMPYINEPVGRDQLGPLVTNLYRRYGNAKTAEVLDEIKRIGFHYATRSGTTVGITDIATPAAKERLIQEAEAEVEKVEQQHRRGLLTSEERYQRVCDIWARVKDEVTREMWDNLDPFNPVYMMANSGARGNKAQLSQLAGMRGLVNDPTGRIIEFPIKANFREGLSVLEYFISTHGTRKGLADTALRTADSGYLTRRLVDVAQDVVVREEDCGTTEGIDVSAIKEVNVDGDEIIEPLRDRIAGRVTSEPVYHPETNEVLVQENRMIDEEMATYLEDVGVNDVTIRSVLTCRTRHGVCARCYGRNLATGQSIEIGEAVGIIAAQSIGEPGTQLTMRTFHTGGVAGDDITQGLPRIQELFEARNPKGEAVISEIEGTVQEVTEVKDKQEISVVNEVEEISHTLPYNARLKVSPGDTVVAGEELTEGSIDPKELLRIQGVDGVQSYLLREVQRVYRMQGVEIGDKHVEVMVRQMLKKVKVIDSGDTDVLPGSLLDVNEFKEVNNKILLEGKEPAVIEPVLLGITKASLETDSFLSAASFQETTRVLTDAAIKGKTDELLGLKENVILGKLIPAGTGMPTYRNIESDLEASEELEEQEMIE